MGAVFALVHILAIYLNFYSLSIYYIHVCPECKKSAQQFDRTKNEAIFLAPIRWDDRGDGGEGGMAEWPFMTPPPLGGMNSHCAKRERRSRLCQEWRRRRRRLRPHFLGKRAKSPLGPGGESPPFSTWLLPSPS